MLLLGNLSWKTLVFALNLPFRQGVVSPRCWVVCQPWLDIEENPSVCVGACERVASACVVSVALQNVPRFVPKAACCKCACAALSRCPLWGHKGAPQFGSFVGVNVPV